MIDDEQIWLIIGVTVGCMVVLLTITVIINAYITSRRLANVLADVEEVLHADFKNLEEKIEAALLKLRVSEARGNRE